MVPCATAPWTAALERWWPRSAFLRRWNALSCRCRVLPCSRHGYHILHPHLHVHPLLLPLSISACAFRLCVLGYVCRCVSFVSCLPCLPCVSRFVFIRVYGHGNSWTSTYCLTLPVALRYVASRTGMQVPGYPEMNNTPPTTSAKGWVAARHLSVDKKKDKKRKRGLAAGEYLGMCTGVCVCVCVCMRARANRPERARQRGQG